MKHTLKRTSKKLLYLLACALNEKTPEIKHISETDSDRLFSLAHMHGVSAMASISLMSQEDHDIIFTGQNLEKWQKAANAALKRRALFDMERSSLLSDLEDLGIWYCPLKGIIIQDLYPEYGMREMADNDLLFDENKCDALRNYMINRGYRLDFEGVTNHDEFVKDPVYNFEFHTRLFMHTLSTVFTDYYDKVKNRLQKDEDNDFGYHFSDDDFYIYFTAHAYKHYKEGGTGFKTLTDFYVLNKNYANSLDRTYIDRELGKLGIAEFERSMRPLSEKLFRDPGNIYHEISKLSDPEKELLSFISRSGAYGTDEQRVKEKVSRITGKKSGKITGADRAKYFASRLFPDMNYYREAHPFLYENKALIPFFVVFRAAYRPVVNRKKILEELRTVVKM